MLSRIKLAGIAVATVAVAGLAMTSASAMSRMSSRDVVVCQVKMSKCMKNGVCNKMVVSNRVCSSRMKNCNVVMPSSKGCMRVGGRVRMNNVKMMVVPATYNN